MPSGHAHLIGARRGHADAEQARARRRTLLCGSELVRAGHPLEEICFLWTSAKVLMSVDEPGWTPWT